MKTLKKILIALFAIACVGMTVACNKDNDNNNGGGSGNTDSRLVGTWEISSIMLNGQDMSQMVRGSQIIMNANGSGSFLIMGQNNSFTWSTNGNILTVIPSGNNSETITCNIASITATTCTLTSNNMSFPGVGPIEGEVTITLTKAGGDPDPQPDTNDYNTLILGTWQVDHMTYNGVDVTSQMLHRTVKLSFYQGGTGLLNDNGETQNNDFSWVITGNTITVTEHGHSMNFTINSLTSTECTFTGTNMEMDGEMLEGDITIHMTKDNGSNPGPGPEPINGSLAGSSWQYATEYNNTEESQGQVVSTSTSVSLTVSFTNETQGTASMSISMTTTLNGTILPEGTFTENETSPFTYTYNQSTHEGSLTATVENPETHQSETKTLPFTYDSENDVIVATDPDYDPENEGNMLPQTITLTHIR